MEELVKHSLGLCGDTHPSLLNLSPILVGLTGTFTYIKFKIKSKLWNQKMN